VVLRLLQLKHLRNWSYHVLVLEREVRANLVYRQFTRVGTQKVPDAKTLGRLAYGCSPAPCGGSLRSLAAPARGCVIAPARWVTRSGRSPARVAAVLRSGARSG
jgi:IS5 family transposase